MKIVDVDGWQPWQMRLAGVSLAWWLPALSWMWPQILHPGLVALVVLAGAGIGLSVASESESRRVKAFAAWFAWGAASSMLLALLCVIYVLATFSAGAPSTST